MIQIVFKYELATSLDFSLNTSKDGLYENTVRLRYSIVTVPYDTNMQYSLFNVTAGRTVQQCFLYILFYIQFIYILNSKPGYLSTILK